VRVDGQRQPTPPELALTLRDTDLLALPLPLVKEGLPMSAFYEAGGWVETVPAAPFDARERRA
jgi:hypothetical protein